MAHWEQGARRWAPVRAQRASAARPWPEPRRGFQRPQDRSCPSESMATVARSGGKAMNRGRRSRRCWSGLWGRRRCRLWCTRSSREAGPESTMKQAALNISCLSETGRLTGKSAPISLRWPAALASTPASDRASSSPASAGVDPASARTQLPWWLPPLNSKRLVNRSS